MGGLGIAGLINLAMLGVAAALFADAAEPMPANCPVGNHGEKTTSVSRVNASSSSELCSRRLNRWVTAAIGAISLAAVNCSTLTFDNPI